MRGAASGRPLVHSERSEEHTSELQSRENLVCRLLLEKKKKKRGRNSLPLCERFEPLELRGARADPYHHVSWQWCWRGCRARLVPRSRCDAGGSVHVLS